MAPLVLVPSARIQRWSLVRAALSQTQRAHRMGRLVPVPFACPPRVLHFGRRSPRDDKGHIVRMRHDTQMQTARNKRDTKHGNPCPPPVAFPPAILSRRPLLSPRLAAPVPLSGAMSTTHSPTTLPLFVPLPPLHPLVPISSFCHSSPATYCADGARPPRAHDVSACACLGARWSQP